jgi:hypothetical protein
LSCFAHFFALYSVPLLWLTQTVIVPPEEASAYAPPPATSSAAAENAVASLEKRPMRNPLSS